MRSRRKTRPSGIVLIGIIVLILVITIVGLSVLALARTEFTLVHQDIHATKALYLAEAGLTQLVENFNNRKFDSIAATDLADGQFWVDVDPNKASAISTGRVGTAIKRIYVEPTFLAGLYEKGIHAGNSKGQPFDFALRGKGNPVPVGRNEQGGADAVYGDIFVNGNVHLFEESTVHSDLSGEYAGDVDATGQIEVVGTASIDGAENPGVPNEENPKLVDMEYEIHNNHHLADLFKGTSWGRLLSNDDLKDVVIKNPTDRSAENASTPGDDYYFEPRLVSGGGTQKDAPDLLDLGQNQIYYVDGDVWVHNLRTYGFTVKGQATIVATGNIHICDNIKYADNESLLGLVALGDYDEGGNLMSGGNIYFGDPKYGTTYTVSALMFAADSFLYNTNSTDPQKTAQEPTTGFEVFGNFAALNQVAVERDWYTDTTRGARAARFDPEKNQWFDLLDGITNPLTAKEIGSLRHYQMKLTYDERVRSPETQPPGLPRGGGSIFAGLTAWREVRDSE